MRSLVIATNSTPRHVVDEIERGIHNRIDYLELARRFRTRHVDYDVVNMNPQVRKVEELSRLDVQQAAHAAQLVRDGRYDVVISLSERVGIPLSYLIDRRVKHVVIMHHPMSKHKLRMMKLMGRKWDIIYALSTAEADGLRKALRLGPDVVRVLQTAVDTAFYQPSASPTPGDEPDHILSLGLSYRDYPTLLRAMARLPHARAHIRAGSTWVHHQAGYEGQPIPQNIELKPYVHPSVLRDVYTRSRFAVVPIRQTTQWSAGCTSVQLAQAMGKAVIATRMPGLSDYVIDGETGLLVDCGDEMGLARAIDELWRNPKRAEEMGRLGREWIKENFSLEQWIDTITNDVSSLLYGSRSGVVRYSAPSI